MKLGSNPWKSYGAAVALTVLVFAFSELVLGVVLAGRHPLLILLLAVSISAAYGGFGPGLLSTALAVLLAVYTYEPYGVMHVAHLQDQVRLVLLAVIGIIISALFQSVQTARRDEAAALQRLQRELEARGEVERTLLESRNTFELMAAAVPETVFVTNSQGQFEFLNSRWTEFTGLDREVSLGNGWRAAVRTDDLPNFDTRLAEAVQLALPLEVRLRLRSREGVYRTYLLRASPSRRHDGMLRWFGSFIDIEDVERAAIALRASEERLKAAVDAAELGTFAWDAGSGDILWSDRALEILGAPGRGVQVGGALLARLKDKDGSDLAGTMRAAASRGAGSRFRGEFTLEGGEQPRSVLAAGVITEVAGARPDQPSYQCVGAIVDLRREKAAIAQVRSLQAGMELAVESTQLGIWDADLQRATVTLSPRARALFGVAPETPVTPAALRNCIAPEDVDLFERSWNAALDPAGNGRFDVDHRVRQPNGELAWVSAVGQACFEGSGPARCAVRIAGTVRDISERKCAERRLAAQEERFRLAAEASEGLVYSTDLRSGRVERTGGLFDMLGWHPDEVPATIDWWHERIDRDDLVRLQTEFAAAVRSRARRVTCRYRARHRLGPWRHLIDRAVVLYGDDGAPMRVIGCVQDVTGSTETARDLREADTKKDRFLAVLAHELRNPIAPLRNAVSILRTAEFDRPELLQSVEILDRQLRHATRLVDDLLDIGRIGRGTLELRLVACRLREVIQSAIETVRPALEERGQRLDVHIDVGDSHVLLDSVRVAQVVANLLGNASKFSPTGGVIELGASIAGSEAQITVRDYGRGIPPAELGRIFEMYEQLDRSQSAAQDGLGVGLALSKHLVEMHGGQIRAYSDGRGTGARFVVSLPLQAAGAVDLEVAGSSSTKVLRIVIADDNVDSAESLAVLLSLDGHRVRVAHDGAAAVRLTLDNTPDLVILDLGMPGMDGHEAAARIRGADSGSDIVLVALSGYAQPADRARSREVGFDMHLVKPLDPAQLRDVLAVAAHGRQAFRDRFAEPA